MASTIDLAILGLLKDEPLHGYELKKRLAASVGTEGALSFGSLYPALRRLERRRAIERTASPDTTPESSPSTGSVSGESAMARSRLRRTEAVRRPRKAYRITAEGHTHFEELADGEGGTLDPARAFALRLAFCRHLPSDARRRLFERRRDDLAAEIERARDNDSAVDPYERALAEHRAGTIARDLAWVESLLASESPVPTTPSPAPSVEIRTHEGAPA